jgi:hypothetical protein
MGWWAEGFKTGPLTKCSRAFTREKMLVPQTLGKHAKKTLNARPSTTLDKITWAGFDLLRPFLVYKGMTVAQGGSGRRF